MPSAHFLGTFSRLIAQDFNVAMESMDSCFKNMFEIYDFEYHII